MLDVSFCRALIRWEPFRYDFKGYSSALEVEADVSGTDIFCQNMYGKICFTLNTHLFLLMTLSLNLNHRSIKSKMEAFCSHLYVFPFAVRVWQTSFTTLSSSTLESVNLFLPIQYKRHPRYFPNGMQYSTETILDFMFRGRGNWKLGWISQFDLTSTCIYCMVNLKKATSEIENVSAL